LAGGRLGFWNALRLAGSSNLLFLHFQRTNKMQKVLVVSTQSDSIRDNIIGWTFNDANEVRDAFEVRASVYRATGTKNEYETFVDVPIHKIRSGYCISYPTILHALADNWKLLAPPARCVEPIESIDGEEQEQEYFEWWLVKD